MRRLVLVLLGCCAAAAQEPDFRFFGSLGGETQVSPANPASPLNPHDFLEVPLYAGISDVTLFGDLSTQDKSWKLHFKMRESNSASSTTNSKLDVDELYVSFSATSWLDLGIGRRIEKWGTGYAWNPTGVVNPLKNPTDPDDHLDAFRGVDALGADLLVKGWNVTILGIPQFDWNGHYGKALAGTGWAARAYKLVDGIDLSFTASGGSGLPGSEGVSLSRVFGNALELHAEGAYIDNTIRYVPVNDALAEPFEAIRRKHGEILVGGQYTFPKNVNVIVEYFHTGNALSAQEWSRFRQLVQAGQIELGQGNPETLLAANQYFAPLAMRSDYGFARVEWPVLQNKLEVETIVITSLRDGSLILRPGIYWRIRPNVRLYWIQTTFLGGAATEIGQIPLKRISEIGFRYSFSLHGRRSGKI
jgi:hypothetical protein